MSDLPAGTVTFLFTDIEGSTRLLHHLGDRYAGVLSDYRQILRTAVREAGGYEVDASGDAFFAAFPRARDALAAAIAGQEAFVSRSWPQGTALWVRMALHTGEPVRAGGGYVGLDVHRAARLCAVGHGGQILLSQTTHDLVEHDLAAGMDLRDLSAHRLKDLLRPERIFQLVHPGLPADFPPLRSLDVLPNNLPIQLTTFVGRERDMEEVKRLLAGTRLLTLTGTGGCGKTRLALQVAAELLEEFRDGVWLVELAALADPALIPQAVASALGVREEPGRPLLATLTDHLHPRHLLLILDNCEQVVAACARLAEALLRACPTLRVLATSREPLGIAGETTWRVPSLSLPDPQRLPSLEHLAQYEAVRLFVDRAAAVQPSFVLTPRNAPAVAQVCQRLDGIPLAIELAAARARVLTVEQIARRLDDRFRLLTGGSRTAMPRHQTLRATMDWSHALLSGKEQALLRRLSVFSGGFTLEAAEAVSAGGEVETPEILDVVGHLVDKSLVMVDDQPPEVRYRLLETVRQYGLDHLLETGEAADVRRRHRDFFLALAERAELELLGPDQAVWLDRLEAEHHNLQNALEWSLGGIEADAALRLAGALWRFWFVRGHWSPGREWLERALALRSGASPAAAGKALQAAGFLVYTQDDYARARAWLEDGLVLYRELGDARGIADTLNLLGNVARSQGGYDLAAALHQESLGLLVEIGDRTQVANTLSYLGWVAHDRGDYDGAASWCERSLALFRDLGSKRGIALCLILLGGAASHHGDFARAKVLCEEGLASCREVGWKYGIALSLETAAVVALRQGEHARAAAFLEEGLSLHRAQGNRRGAAHCLERLADILCARGQAERAAHLIGAAERLREAIGVPVPPAVRPDHDRCAAQARAALGEEAFTAARAAGRAMSLEEAVAAAFGPQDAPRRAQIPGSPGDA
ncbi:MAG: tetratricopeptide repeat protein [Armatimonadetes bacterium]|nr:tetratricopeptide repeat protein [Armatimonadota bacterium]